MNYLKNIAQRIDISINGYKTPKNILKIRKPAQTSANQRNYSVIYINPPFNGKTEN